VKYLPFAGLHVEHRTPCFAFNQNSPLTLLLIYVSCCFPIIQRVNRHGTATIPFGKGRQKYISSDRLIFYMKPPDLLLPEAKPDPLGDIMLKFLIDQNNESAYVDFKEVIDISKEGPFAKIAKDIFAFSNYGGGFILIGFKERKSKNQVNEEVAERPTRTLLEVGLPEGFHIDQASLQEKFNAYSNSPIEIRYREFWRKIDGTQRKFAAIYGVTNIIIR
jgi:hypothetical protein